MKIPNIQPLDSEAFRIVCETAPGYFDLYFGRYASENEALASVRNCRAFDATFPRTCRYWVVREGLSYGAPVEVP